MIPADSRVEIDAKIAAGYFTNGNVMTMDELSNVQGRAWEDVDVSACSSDYDISLTVSIALITEAGVFLLLKLVVGSHQGVAREIRACMTDCVRLRLTGLPLPKHFSSVGFC